MRRLALPWRSRGLVAGLAGTAALASWYHLWRRLRRGRYSGVPTLADGTLVGGMWSEAGLDYDDSIVPGQIVARLIRLPEPTPLEAKALALTLRWSYGTVFGLAHVMLRNKFREPYATAIFGTALMAVASIAFPLLGRTPVPWRWPLEAQVNSIGSHAAYIVTASVVDNMLR